MNTTIPVWQADTGRQQASLMQRYIQWLDAQNICSLLSYDDLYAWSLANISDFWTSLASFCEVKWITEPMTMYVPPPAGKMLGAKWGAGAKLNFADNLLKDYSTEDMVLSALREGETRPRRYSRLQLWNQVALLAEHLKKQGVGPGDRVAGALSNDVAAVVAMLATASLGGIWTSSSPDFGAAGMLDRFAQVSPKVFFAEAAYRYSGKVFATRDRMLQVARRLPGLSELIWVHGEEFQDLKIQSKGMTESFSQANLFDLLAKSSKLNQRLDIQMHPCQFDDPLYILFSSGTTSVPKCIVHTVGGTLLQHLKELMLHSDVKPGAKLFFYTTCGWMMWNWMVTGLAAGAHIYLYDGTVMDAEKGSLWDFVALENIETFGTSPKFITACQKAELSPTKRHKFSELRTILTTGSPLAPPHYEWIYQRVKKDVHLASISGGTDIVSCFMLGNPLRPVIAGEIQGPGLGMAIDSWDEVARPVRNRPGELVCTKPFPSMPKGFWNDRNGAKYRSTYFEHFAGMEVWRHGDFIEFSATGGIIVHGRSDATLNPGGVRIGTAEIYAALEGIPEVVDSVCFAASAADNDVDIILLVKCAEGVEFTDHLHNKIKSKIRSDFTPRHVPKMILPVTDIPYTRSGKKMELLVQAFWHGKIGQNIEAVANPECLTQYKNLNPLLKK